MSAGPSATTGITPCPYPGLRAFFTDEEGWYYGREEQVTEMLDRLTSSRFLAVVGPSGSGKSSLVFAGLIPALHEGLAINSRRINGVHAPWHVICAHPGDSPLDNLAAAIAKAGSDPDDPHTLGFIRASLGCGGAGLVEALQTAELINDQTEVLIYIDQFEELFRGSENAGRESQENALHFAKLIVTACEQKKVRLHVLLSMRSEFIGECDRFTGLPQLVSQSQFLTPRLTRQQLLTSIDSPAKAAGKEICPDVLNALLNDCGTHPDQLPLAQHVLRRMWMAVAREGRDKLTLNDYKVAGGFGKSVDQHGQEILNGLPKPQGEEIARSLFMALCEQREEGPLVRRLSTQSEVEAIVGTEHAGMVEQVIRAFGGDDPGFIREDDGDLDVRHEAILRQWGKIADWRKLEATAEETLDALSRDADEYFEEADSSILWMNFRLEKLQKWEGEVRPTKAWAKRHHVSNWDRCHAFMVLSADEEKKIQNEKAAAIKKDEDTAKKQKRYEKAMKIIFGIAFVAAVAVGIVLFLANQRANLAERGLIALEKKLQEEVEYFRSEMRALEEKNRELTNELSKTGVARDVAQESAVAAGLENKKQSDELTRLNDLVATLQKAAAPSLPQTGSDPILRPDKVAITLNWLEPQQRARAMELRPKLLDAGFTSVNVAASATQRPLEKTESPERATEVMAIASAVASDALQGEVERASLAISFEEKPGSQPAIEVWVPLVSPLQKLTSAVVAGTVTPTNAAVEIAKLGQPAVAALVKQLEGANEQSRRPLQLVAALTLRKMPQPVILNAEEAKAIVTLLAADDSSTRKNTTEFLMDLWDGESIRSVFNEVKELLDDNLGATPSDPDRKSEHAVYNAASLLGTWARNLNNSIEAPAGSGSKLMRDAALAAAKDLHNRLSSKRQQWGSTLELLEGLIEKVEPTIFIRLENRRVTPLPAPYAKYAVYVCNFASSDKTVRIYICPAAGQRTDYLSEDKFKEHNGAAAMGPIELTEDKPISIKYAEKSFAVTLKHIHASSVWKDFATFTFKPE